MAYLCWNYKSIVLAIDLHWCGCVRLAAKYPLQKTKLSKECAKANHLGVISLPEWLHDGIIPCTKEELAGVAALQGKGTFGVDVCATVQSEAYGIWLHRQLH